MNNQQTSITRVRWRLSQRIKQTVTQEEFAILLHGWRRHPKYHSVTVKCLTARKARDSKEWFSHQEIISLSKYAGYDLTTDE